MQITRRIVFHAGHMLKDDNSKCYHPHGHEYVLECTIEGLIKTEGAENGMVMNFGGLKELMMREVHDVFDHKFLVEFTDPRCDDFLKAVGHDGCFLATFAPTAENIVKWVWDVLSDYLPEGVCLSKVRLQETYQCWVEYDGND